MRIEYCDCCGKESRDTYADSWESVLLRKKCRMAEFYDLCTDCQYKIILFMEANLKGEK